MKKLLIAGMALVLAGCVAKPTMYYWGDYSDTLYLYKSEPSGQTLAKHYASIQDVFNKSQEYGLRVPPGVNAEYATLLLKEGKKADALIYFQKEKSIYPESAVLMDRMIQMVGAQQ
ncbi:DUF4810 domain-containing protein [Psychrosphaera haliotis]|uniref:DUF4810 domain-containing protein n=1 Tax=Psychrosphaera haliotis TaxID=555083 RepID=A0A6N8FCI2_9GAMM|nr:DUF4810 domain-containing protein [Psychrosphaera haliotis]MUH72700.1 DUF4810 domain-containing protein [Psychrosphaera haliotis]